MLFWTLLLILLVLPPQAAAQAAGTDPALCLPAVAALARQYPVDWEQRLDPMVRPIVIWQRIVGAHAEIIGWANEQPNPSYPHPRVVVDVADWDQSDLFQLGLPRTYDQKPVVIHETVIPQAALPGQAPVPTASPAPGCPGAPYPAAALPTQLPATGAHGVRREWLFGLLLAGLGGLSMGIWAYRRRPPRDAPFPRRS